MAREQTVMMVFPDGTSAPIPHHRIAEALAAKAVIQKRPLTTVSGHPNFPGIAQEVADRLVGPASIAGSIAGGVAGTAASPFMGPAAPVGPIAGRMAGGVAGGTAAQALREGVYRATGSRDAPGSIAGEAQNQVTSGLTGEALGGAMGLVGRLPIRASLPLKAQDAWKAVEEMIRNRIPVGGIGRMTGNTARNVPIVGPSLVKGGVEATENWAEKSASRAAVNAAAGAQGITIPRKTAEDVLKNLISEAEGTMGEDAEVRYFKRVLASWRKRKGDQLMPAEVQRIVTKFNLRSAPVHRAMKGGAAIPGQAMQARAAQQTGIASAFSDELGVRVPGWKEFTAKLGPAIAAKNAIKRSEADAMKSLGARFVGGSALTSGVDAAMGERDPAALARHGVVGGLGGAAISSPAVLSRLGLFMTDPMLQMLLRQGPRSVRPPEESR